MFDIPQEHEGEFPSKILHISNSTDVVQAVNQAWNVKGDHLNFLSRDPLGLGVRIENLYRRVNACEAAVLTLDSNTTPDCWVAAGAAHAMGRPLSILLDRTVLDPPAFTNIFPRFPYTSALGLQNDLAEGITFQNGEVDALMYYRGVRVVSGAEVDILLGTTVNDATTILGLNMLDARTEEGYCDLTRRIVVDESAGLAELSAVVDSESLVVLDVTDAADRLAHFTLGAKIVQSLAGWDPKTVFIARESRNLTIFAVGLPVISYSSYWGNYGLRDSLINDEVFQRGVANYRYQ